MAAPARTPVRAATALGTSWTHRLRWHHESLVPSLTARSLVRQYSGQETASFEVGQSVKRHGGNGLDWKSPDALAQKVMPTMPRKSQRSSDPVRPSPGTSPGGDNATGSSSPATVPSPTQLPSEEQSKSQQAQGQTWKSGYRTMLFADLPVEPVHTDGKLRPLRARPGLPRFLNLQALEPRELPGMVFDLGKLDLSVDEKFPSRLMYVQDAKHHEVVPWISKAFLQRARAWRELDSEDLTRVEHPTKKWNSTHRRHRGNTKAFATFLMDLAEARKENIRFGLQHATWPGDLGPTLPPRLAGFLDGMGPEDVSLRVQTYQKNAGHSESRQILSCVLVAVNAPLRAATYSWEALAGGRSPDPDLDALRPVMREFGRWLKSVYRPQEHKSGRGLPQPRAKGKIGTQSAFLQDMIPDAHAIPVVFAWRQKYIWFLWTGGDDGQLVAQYASHWLPIREVERDAHGANSDFDTRLRRIQSRLLQSDATDSLERVKINGGAPRSGLDEVIPESEFAYFRKKASRKAGLSAHG